MRETYQVLEDGSSKGFGGNLLQAGEEGFTVLDVRAPHVLAQLLCHLPEVTAQHPRIQGRPGEDNGPREQTCITENKRIKMMTIFASLLIIFLAILLRISLSLSLSALPHFTCVRTLRKRGEGLEVGRGAPSTLAEESHSVWVSTKLINVALHPPQSLSLVHQSKVPRHYIVLRRQEPLRSVNIRVETRS